MDKKKRLPGLLVLLMLVIEFAVCALFVSQMELFSKEQLMIGAAVLGVIDLIIFILVFNFYHKVRFLIGVILTFLLAVFMVFGIKYEREAEKALKDIAGSRKNTASVGVYTTAANGGMSVESAAAGKVGVLTILDRVNTNAAVAQMNERMGTEMEISEYPGLTNLVDGLEKGETDAILLNPAYINVLLDMPGYENVEQRIVKIGEEEVEVAVRMPAVKEKKEETAEGEDSEEGAAETEDEEEDSVITCYISGIDTRGEMTASSLTDVNIVAMLNLKTGQVLLVSTPRDYYVPLSISGGVPDKLTHAGIYGIDCCVDTLEMLYDMDIDYYFRINFQGFVKIIDALGGITIHSDYEFSSKNVEGFYFYEGDNKVDGEAALAFARERYSYQEGDVQRGRNQIEVIKGVVKKVASTEMLTNYSEVLASVKDCFETDMPYPMVTELIRTQLTNILNWNIQSYTVQGTDASEIPFSMNVPVYVMIPDQSMVDRAKDLFARVRAGEIIQLEEEGPIEGGADAETPAEEAFMESQGETEPQAEVQDTMPEETTQQ